MSGLHIEVTVHFFLIHSDSGLPPSFHPISTYSCLVSSLSFYTSFAQMSKSCVFYLLFSSYMKGSLLYFIALFCFYLIVEIIPDQFIEIFLILFCSCVVLHCEDKAQFISIVSDILLLQIILQGLTWCMCISGGVLSE